MPRRFNEDLNSVKRDKEKDRVGPGRERICYVHPEESGKAIKITPGPIRKQTDRELKFYKGLKYRKKVSYKHIPQYFGPIDTNLGLGQVFEMIRDYDGNVSKSMLWYLEEGHSLDFFEERLQILHQYFLANQLIFNHDMYAGNILFKKTSDSDGVLIVIDGLGDTVFIDWLNFLPSHARSKIDRRWELFINRLRKRALGIEKKLREKQ